MITILFYHSENLRKVFPAFGQLVQMNMLEKKVNVQHCRKVLSFKQFEIFNDCEFSI